VLLPLLPLPELLLLLLLPCPWPCWSLCETGVCVPAALGRT